MNRCVLVLLCWIAVAALGWPLSSFSQTPLACGQPVSGSISNPLDRQYYAFGALAGDKVALRVARTAGSSFYPLLELYSPAGTLVGSSVAVNPQVVASLAASGIYTAMVSDSGRASTGSYAVILERFNSPCGTSTPITCGQAASGSIAGALQSDYYSFTGNAGDKVTLRVARTSGNSFFPFLELYAPAGDRLGSSSAVNPTIDATLTTAGTYTAIVYDSGWINTGGYSLVWQRLNTPCNAKTISCGQPVNDSVAAAAQLNVYSFAASAGDKVALRVARTSGDSFFPLLELYSPVGDRLGSGSAVSPTVNASLTATGAHTAMVSDSGRVSTGAYSVTWEMSTGPCKPATFSFTASPAALSFSAAAGSAALAPQQLELRSTFPGLPWQATPRTQSGGNWLSVSPTFGQMPAAMLVYADAAGLSAGSYSGSIDIRATGATPPSASIPVTMTVGGVQASSLAVSPANLSFRTLSGGTAPAQVLVVANSGGGVLNWSAQASAGTGGWLTISPPSGTAAPGASGALQVSVNSAGLAVGSYAGSVTVRSSDNNQTVTVPVSLSIAAAQGVLLLSQSNLLFRAVEGGGSEPLQTFGVLNAGSGSLDWTAQAVIRGAVPWLRVSPASGRSDAGTAQIPLVSISVDHTGLAAGLYTGLVRVAASTANNSPQVIRVDLQVLPKGSQLGATVRPTGLMFVAAAGGAAPASQQVGIATPETAAVEYISAPIGGDWIDRTPDTGSATRTAPGQIAVQAKAGSLAPGIYRGGLTILTRNDGQLYPVNVLLMVLPAGSPLSSLAPMARTGASGPLPQVACTASRLVLQFKSVFAQFAAFTGWPSVLQVDARDDCGNPAVGGTVIVSFSSGDPAVMLSDVSNGQYQGTWRPNAASPQVVATAQGLWRGLQGQATATAIVGTQPNPQAPIFNQGGVVLGAGFERGPMAPGSIVSLFGKNLTARDNFAESVPLPRSLGGLRVIIGDKEAPLFYAGPGQVNVQVPFELAAERQLQILIETNGTPSAPEPLQTADSRPGIFTLGPPFGQQGAILIANTNRLAMPATPNVASEPAKPGGTISIYCTGLGQTEPPVASGEAGPASPLATVKIPVAVAIGGQAAKVTFAGLAPGFVGVYQVNAEVPADLVSGNAVPVVVTQGGFSSNTATIAVQ